MGKIYHMYRCRYELKPRQATTTYLAEWIKFKILTISSASENGEQADPLCVAGGNVKWYIEESPAVSLKTKHITPI